MLTAEKVKTRALAYHLLIKPVLPARLRAMIAYKLGLRQGSQAAG